MYASNYSTVITDRTQITISGLRAFFRSHHERHAVTAVVRTPYPLRSVHSCISKQKNSKRGSTLQFSEIFERGDRTRTAFAPLVRSERCASESSPFQVSAHLPNLNFEKNSLFQHFSGSTPSRAKHLAQWWQWLRNAVVPTNWCDWH